MTLFHKKNRPLPPVKKRWHSLLLFFIVFTVVTSCNQKETQKTDLPAIVQDSTAIRLAQRQLQDSVATISDGKKKIYLTWDDSPNNGTPNVYKTVLEEKVPMSFFVVGLHTKDSPAMWRTLKADSTIELCNHSYTHGLRNHYDRFYQQPPVVISDFQRSQDSLHFTNHIIRMPGRNAWRIGDINTTDVRSSRAAIDSTHSAGFDVMGWDVEWTFDHHTYSPTITADGLLATIHNMLKENKTKTPDNIVILSHDQAFVKAVDVEQLRYFFRKLKENPDYVLLLATQYPGLRK